MKKTIIAGVMALSLVSGLSAVTDFSAVTVPAVTAHASDKLEIASHAGKYTLFLSNESSVSAFPGFYKVRNKVANLALRPCSGIC
ncbi:MAG: hypothetical protein IJJ69_04830 [Oscillospiraceae bacterium]|nr:hypothetical protein [Oscillospiraceae bacterium]